MILFSSESVHGCKKMLHIDGLFDMIIHSRLHGLIQLKNGYNGYKGGTGDSALRFTLCTLSVP